MKHAHTNSLPLSSTTTGAKALTTALGEWSLGIINTLLTWQQRADERRHLSEIDDRLLKDMGLSRADAFNESRKPFWLA